MQFAVFSEDAIVYLGEDPTEAAEAFRLKDGVKLEYADTIEELKERFDAHVSTCKAQSCEKEPILLEDLDVALDVVLKKLEEMNIPENAEACAEKVKETGKKVAKNVRHLGHKMMKTAGENFIWLGDLLKEEAEEMQSSVSPNVSEEDDAA